MLRTDEFILFGEHSTVRWRPLLNRFRHQCISKRDPLGAYISYSDFKEDGMFTLNINGQDHQVDVDPSTPLLWVLRDVLHLTGTKYGCGIEICGACTVHLDGEAEKSCEMAAKEAIGRKITTIEGLSPDRSSALQRAWIAEQVPQCGYCQSGMLMAASSLLSQGRDPSDAQIDAAIKNICVCGTYQRVRAAIHRAAKG